MLSPLIHLIHDDNQRIEQQAQRKHIETHISKYPLLFVCCCFIYLKSKFSRLFKSGKFAKRFETKKKQTHTNNIEISQFCASTTNL